MHHFFWSFLIVEKLSFHDRVKPVYHANLGITRTDTVATIRLMKETPRFQVNINSVPTVQCYQSANTFTAFSDSSKRRRTISQTLCSTDLDAL
jgi:hypothetical protein